MPVWMVRSGRWPLRTTCRRPAASLRWEWASTQAATSASMASASIRRAPSRRISVRTSWPWGKGTMRMSVVDCCMAGDSSASWADRWARNGCITKDTPPPFSRPSTTFGYTPSMDRLARNVDDLRRIVQRETQRGVRVQFVKENLTFTGEDAPMSHLMLSVLGAVAQFERDLIKERQREGIALAKQRGAYRGRGKVLPGDKVAELRRRAGAGEKKARLAREFGISRETLYQYLRQEHGERQRMAPQQRP